MKAQDFLNDRSDHHVKFLFKSFLLMLEDLKKTHEINFNMADYFDEDYYQNYRKKILDIGNSVLRDYNSELENLTVEFKFKK